MTLISNHENIGIVYLTRLWSASLCWSPLSFMTAQQNYFYKKIQFILVCCLICSIILIQCSLIGRWLFFFQHYYNSEVCSNKLDQHVEHAIPNAANWGQTDSVNVTTLICESSLRWK